MAKIICALLSLSAVLFLNFPFHSGSVTVCRSGKSQGEFEKTAFCSVKNVVNFEGVSFSLTDAELNSVIKLYDCKKVHLYESGGVLNEYYYSKKISRVEVISGKKVNFHVAKTHGKVTVGVPLIYYGY
ncbi:MAG: hypothetical protein J6V66_01795 [Clostridia bacterium]|nr:hypothetical protein [Clostridia bacterium]